MQRTVVWLLAALLGLVGITLSVGGVILVADGGSAYYVVTGLAVLVSAFGLVRRAPFAAYAFAAMLAWTIPWSLWEAGLDDWALMPRLVGPALVGLLFLLPPVATAAGTSRWWVGVPAVAALLVMVAAIVHAETRESGLPGATVAALPDKPAGWKHWGNDAGGRKYAPFTQINTGNVAKLKLAWRYDSGLSQAGKLASMEGSPLAADGRLYMCIESGTMVALDQDTGRQIWRYRGLAEGSPFRSSRCRGAAYYVAKGGGADCHKRLFLTTSAGQLIAIDADTGKPCRGFAANDTVDLHEGMGKMDPESALPTSPPAVMNGVVVVGQSISDYGSFDSPSGVIRGYDAETGALRWAWDAGRPGQMRLKPGEIYTRDTPNVWGVLSGDEKLGLVYLGTGNSPPDYFSAFRSKIADRFTASVVALDVATGRLRWSFRTVHHDLWDYDIASQPIAVDLPDGQPALIVPTKRGQLFVLDRRTGKPIDRVVLKPVPQGGVKGEWTSPTQPYTTGFPSLSGDDLRERDMWGMTPIDQMLCRIEYRQANYQGQFTPIRTQWTLTYPSVGGGINWGSASVDPQRGILVVNTLHFANLNRLVPNKPGVVMKGGFEGGVNRMPQAGTPFALENFPFASPFAVPCQKPPFMRIWALDLRTRKLLWSKPLGTAAGSGPFGIATHIPLRLGAPGVGGSMVTAGGLAFIGAVQDRRLRAFDIANGKELWSALLPAVGAANPISYISPRTGRQYIVISAGGHFAVPGPRASAIMAYALPEK